MQRTWGVETGISTWQPATEIPKLENGACLLNCGQTLCKASLVSIRVLDEDQDELSTWGYHNRMLPGTDPGSSSGHFEPLWQKVWICLRASLVSCDAIPNLPPTRQVHVLLSD